MRGIKALALGLGALPHDHGRWCVCGSVRSGAPISCAEQSCSGGGVVNAWGGLVGMSGVTGLFWRVDSLLLLAVQIRLRLECALR